MDGGRSETRVSSASLMRVLDVVATALLGLAEEDESSEDAEGVIPFTLEGKALATRF